MQRKCLACLGSALFTFLPQASLAASTYYVATTGSDAAAGTEAAPFASVVKANSVVAAGDTVYIRGGTYHITEGTNSCASQTDTVNAITLSKSGTAGSLIKFWAAPGETPVFDYADLTANCRVKGFLVSGNYIHMKGIEVTGVKQRNQSNHESWGVWISGSNNLFEQLNIHHIDGTGLFIGKGGNNLVLNSDSHHNFDPLTSNGACESGDGFGAHIAAGGKGNVFRGCRAWFNSDDDFDLINAFESVTIEDCWAWHAGYRYDTGASCGNGNGIKSGGYGTDTSTFPASPPVHVIRGNLAVGNKAAGFYANHHPGDITFYNNTGYGNHPNFNMLGMDPSGKDITVGTYRNNLAVGGTATSNANSPDDDNNSWSLTVTANDADFSAASETGLEGPRQPDGSLPQITNFHLVAGSDLIDKGTDVGLAFNGAKPDLGCFETGTSTAAGGSPAAGGSTATTGGTAAAGRAATGGTTTAGGATGRGGMANAAGKANGGASASGTAGGSTARGGAAASAAGRPAVGGTGQSGTTPNATIQGGNSQSSDSNATAVGANANGGNAAVDGLGGAATAPSSTTRGGSSSNASQSANGGGATLGGSTPPPSSKDATDASESVGCNCRTTSSTSSGHAALTGLLLLGLTALRRRGTRRAPRVRT